MSVIRSQCVSDAEYIKSLRDDFAAKAMLGILSGPASREGATMQEWFDIAPVAYQLADAMLAAREGK